MSASAAPRPEALRAARAALTLGASLLAGIACSMAVRVALPRVLGPVAFGAYRLVETCAELILVFLTLGLDTALRRDVARDPSSAAAHLANVLALRLYGGGVLLALFTAGFWYAGAHADRLALLALLGAAQLMLALNNAHTAVAHGVGDVRWSAGASVVARAAWAVLALLILAVTPSPILVAAAMLAVEAMRFAVQQRRARFSYATSTPRSDLRAAGAAAAASLPLFINFLAHNLYGRLGTWWLGLQAPAAEVGWYGAAANISATALVGMPLVTWVLLPAASREGGKATAQTDALVGGALRLALLIVTPAALLLGALAPQLVVWLFGAAFAPAAPTLARLAPTIALAYGSTVCAVSLIQRGADRTVAAVSVGGLLFSVLLNRALVQPGAPGDAAARAALVALITEIAVTAALAALAWRRAWSASLAHTAVGIAAATSAALLTYSAGGRSFTALAAAGVAYLLTLIVSGAVGMPDVRFVQHIFSRGRTRAALAS